MEQDKVELIITDALDEMMDVIRRSPIPRFRTDDRLRVVNSDDIAEMITEIKTQLPDEIRRANSVLSQIDTKIQSATDYANKIAADAERNADDTMMKATSNAQKTVNDANAYYDTKVTDGDRYFEDKTAAANKFYDDRIAQAQDDAAAIIEQANAERDRLISVHEVTIAAQQEAEEYREDMARRANQIFNNANKRADETLSQLMGYLQDYYHSIKGDREKLLIVDDKNFRNPNEQPAQQEPAQTNERPDAPSFFDLFKRKRKPQEEDEFDNN